MASLYKNSCTKSIYSNVQIFIKRTFYIIKCGGKMNYKEIVKTMFGKNKVYKIGRKTTWNDLTTGEAFIDCFADGRDVSVNVKLSDKEFIVLDSGDLDFIGRIYPSYLVQSSVYELPVEIQQMYVVS